MVDNYQCIVIFPVYKPISTFERECFEQAVKLTKGYKKVFIAPDSFQIDDTFGESLKSLDIIRFEDSFFQGIEGYNLLMLSDIFYNTFAEYKYMLIHQSDAYLFKPELKYWCDQNYDYIGAPWFKPNLSHDLKIRVWKMKYLSFLYSEERREDKRYYLLYNNIGNGGLSLRKISSFIDVLHKTPLNILNKYKQTCKTEYNEDVFWGLEASKLRRFKKPSLKKALKFSFEEYPSIAYKMNNNELPFGCHAFNVHETEFWKQFIPPLNT